jgi:hypothetical protein
MRSGSESKPKTASCEEARRGKAKAALAMMVVVVVVERRCNNAMRCNAGGLGTSIGGGVGGCRGVGFLDWERNGRTARETVVSETNLGDEAGGWRGERSRYCLLVGVTRSVLCCNE